MTLFGSLNDALPFADRHHTVNRHPRDALGLPVRPAHLHPVDARRAAQTEVSLQVIGRAVAGATADPTRLALTTRFDTNTTTDTSAVAPRAHEMHLEPVVPARKIVVEQP